MKFSDFFTNKMLVKYLNEIFGFVHNGFRPSLDLYIATADYLDEGLWAGFGQSLFDMDVDSVDKELLRDLRDNLHVFSAFKSHHSAQLLSELIWDDKGEKRNFTDFRADAMKMFNITHDTHLKTEFRTSVANGRSANQWREITRDESIFPYLKYSTIGDERVRDDHDELDGITRKTNDSFWAKHFPPNGFNCRCDVEKMTGLETDFKTTDKRKLKSLPEIPKLFQMNAGVDRVIFSPKHPYFTVADRYKVAAKDNFGLPLKYGKHKND